MKKIVKNLIKPWKFLISLVITIILILITVLIFFVNIIFWIIPVIILIVLIIIGGLFFWSKFKLKNIKKTSNEKKNQKHNKIIDAKFKVK